MLISASLLYQQYPHEFMIVIYKWNLLGFLVLIALHARDARGSGFEFKQVLP